MPKSYSMHPGPILAEIDNKSDVAKKGMKPKMHPHAFEKPQISEANLFWAEKRVGLTYIYETRDWLNFFFHN